MRLDADDSQGMSNVDRSARWWPDDELVPVGEGAIVRCSERCSVREHRAIVDESGDNIERTAHDEEPARGDRRHLVRGCALPVSVNEPDPSTLSWPSICTAPTWTLLSTSTLTPLGTTTRVFGPGTLPVFQLAASSQFWLVPPTKVGYVTVHAAAPVAPALTVNVQSTTSSGPTVICVVDELRIVIPESGETPPATL